MTDDWREMDTDVLDAPPNWAWTIDDELAHHLWNLTARTKEVNFGPDPPLLLEALMGFFDERSMADSINNWYFTRKTGQQYNDYTVWWDIPAKFKSPAGDPDTTSVLYSEDTKPHPLRSKLHGQQYTMTGGMFTYEFQQWQGEEPTGFMRIPVPSELLDEAIERVESLPFEKHQYQARMYRQEFAEVPTPDGTFAHPHFTPAGSPTQKDYMDLFETAFQLMKRGARIEMDQSGGSNV